MSELLFFVLGLIIGGLIWISLMCLFQINRLTDNRLKEPFKEKNEKKNC